MCQTRYKNKVYNHLGNSISNILIPNMPYFASGVMWVFSSPAPQGLVQMTKSHTVNYEISWQMRFWRDFNVFADFEHFTSEIDLNVSFSFKIATHII